MKRGNMEIRLLALVSLLGMLAACNLQRCSEGAVCQVTRTTGPTAIPSPIVAPSEKPTPTPTPALQDPCFPTRADLHFHSSPGEDRIIMAGATRGLDFTPYKGEAEIPASCNRNRFPVWSIETVRVNPASPSICTLTQTVESYIPILHASTRVGDRCIVRAVLSVANGGELLQFSATLEAEVK